MNLRSKWCLYGLLSWAAMAGIASAQQPPGVIQMGPSAEQLPPPLTSLSESVGQTNLGNGMGYTTVNRQFRPQFNLDTRGGGLYGYSPGYTNLGMFVPYAIEGDSSILFLDARGLVTNDGGGGANIGTGWRWWMQDIDRVVGLSAWYDHDGGHTEKYNQIGLSFESLGRYIDYRVNGYIPVGEDSHVVGSAVTGSAFFSGNNIVQTRLTATESAYTGFDVESGGPLPLLGRYGVSGYAGVYYFRNNDQGDFTGVSGRLSAQINEDVSIGMQVTNDAVFDFNAQFQLQVTLPDGMPSRWLRQLRVKDRLFHPVWRNYRVTTTTDTTLGESPAINPDDLQPYFVVHVNPNATVAGNGTLELPYQTIAQFNNLNAPLPKGQADIIYVQPNTNGTSAGLNTGVQLLNGQKLWGSTIAHTLTTTDGTYTLPPLTTGSALPVLANSNVFGGAVVTLANRNEVSGFTIDGSNTGAPGINPPNNGIVSQAGGITGFDINNNSFINNLTAVQISHTGSALGLLTNNTVTGGPAAGIDAGFRSNGGFDVTQTGGTLDLLVQNNNITNVRGEDRNGNGLLDPTEDLNNNGSLDPGEDVNGNGVLDLSEDTNGNLALDHGIGMRFVSSGPGATINANDATSLTQPTGILSNSVTASSSGIEISAVLGGTFNADVIDNTLNNNTNSTGFGFHALADGPLSTLTINTYSGNSTVGNAGSGLVLEGNNGGVLTFVPTLTSTPAPNNLFNTNGDDGLRVVADAGTVTLTGISGANFAGNGGDGVELRSLNAGAITIDNPLDGNTFTQNGANGLFVNAASGTINVDLGTAGALATNTFNNNGTAAGGGNGVLFQTGTGGTINTSVFGVTSSTNGTDGIGFDLNGGVINVDGIQNNFASGNTQDGLSIVNGNGGVFTTPLIADNDFSNNNRASLFFGGTVGGADSFNNITTITRNNFNRTTSGTEGILFDTLNVFVQGSAGGGPVLVTRNTFVGRAPAGGRGIGGEIEGGGVNFEMGSFDPADVNTFTNNVDAHIGLILSGDSVNRFTMDNHLFQGAVNGANTDFNGEGVAFILRDSASLDGFIRRSIIQNNASDGVRFDVTGNNAIPGVFASLNNFTIGSTTTGLGNIIQNNGSDGIEVFRSANGQVNNMQILNNLIQTNTANGVRLVAANSDSLDTYTVGNNDILTNAFDGILIDVRADADLDVDIDNNLIDSNGTVSGRGIHTIEQVNNGSDSRSVSGNWTRNTITNNGLDGIHLDAASNGLVIGSSVNPALGNDITDNLRNGIQVQGPGDVTIGNNLIARNGTANTVSTANETAGIQAHVRPFSQLFIISNDITDNRGDGIEYSIASNFFGFQSQITMDGNVIDFNDGRGVDILNRTRNFIQVAMTDNVVNSNLLEGVYVVNTTSATQNQFNTSTQALAQDGALNDNPVIEMQFDNNQVLANGINTTFQNGGAPTATGLVVRVGTSGGQGGPTFDGGFASNAAAVAIGGSPWGNSTFRGGVTMTVDNSRFDGNFGDDILFQSFVSTVPNPASGTTWNQTTYNPTGYQSDPLARLDLYFRNNTFNSQDVNNGQGVASANTQRVAYYNNADGQFKSRLGAPTIVAPNVPGPFNSATRRRNAQRQAARIPNFDAPLISPDGGTFLYPGMGASTFRVSLDSNLGIFLLDNAPYNDTTDANGFTLPFNGSNGELGYGWGTF